MNRTLHVQVLQYAAFLLIFAAAASLHATVGQQTSSEKRESASSFPLGIAVGADDAVYVTERSGHRVVRIDASGNRTVVAGTGTAGFSGDGGPATDAKLQNPDSVDLDEDGNIHIADRGNHRIRRVDATTGEISTIAGNGQRGVSEDGDALTRSLAGPYYLHVRSKNALLFCDTDSHRIRELDLRAGTITTVAGNGERGFAGDDGPAIDASLSRPHVVTTNGDDELIIGDSFNLRIRRVDTDGVIRTIAGVGEVGLAPDGAAALEAPFGFFGGICALGDGDLLITEWIHGRVLRYDAATARLNHIAGNPDESTPLGSGATPLTKRFGSLGGIATDAGGRIIVAAPDLGAVFRIDLKENTVVDLLDPSGMKSAQ